MQRGELTKRILEHLMNASSDMLYLFAAIVVSPYGASRRQIERKMEELREGSTKSKADLEKIRQRQQSFYNIVYQLRRDGFIKKAENRKLLITVLGRKKYEKILNRLPKRNHKPQIDNSLKVFIFDIPERERHKRKWLRGQLRDLGFKMVQKSVWMGRKKIPEEFLEDIRNLKLLAYVEIFAVTKTGSIRTIK